MTDAPLLVVDFETRSLASIKELGSRRYAQHETTQVLCACFAWRDPDSQRVESFRWAPAALGPEGWSSPFPFGDVAVGSFAVLAHNHYFDARVWERLEWPAPARWIDSSELARRAGMPSGKLEWLGANLLGAPKDMEGNRLMLSLSRPWKPPRETKAQAKLRSKPGYVPETPRLFAIDPVPADVLSRIVDYCELDARLACRLFYEHLEPWDHVSDLEDAILAADRAINERGMHFDADLARAVLRLDERLASEALAAAGITDPTDVRGNDRFRAALAALGVVLADAQKATVEPLLEHPDERVAALAAARLSGNTIAGGKLKSGLLKLSPDGTIKDMLRYIGAHTWRWSGSNPQPQNLPKPAQSLSGDAVDALVRRALA